MAVESGTANQPIVDAGTQVGTPVATMGFGARETADETRQAQHREANDAIADVQMNDIFSREQAGTMVIAGKGFASEANRLDTMANANLDWREIHKGRLFGAKKDA